MYQVALNDHVLISCGGGGKRFGLTNYLALYPKIFQGGLKEPIQTVNLGDEIYEHLRVNRNQKITCNSEDKCVVLNVVNNQVDTLAKFKSDYSKKDPYINDVVINPNGDVLAAGGDDGMLRLYNEEYTLRGQITMNCKIQSLDFHISKPLLIVAGNDYECRIVDYREKRITQKLTIADKNINDLKFHSAYYSLDEQTIFTFKNPMRGASYMTVWSISGEQINALKTVKIHSQPITTSCQSKEGMFLAVGCADGVVKIINARYHDIESKSQAHEMVTKGVAFTPDSRYVLSGSVDYTYNIMQNVRPEGWFSKFTKLWFIGMLVAYLITIIISFF